MHPFVILGRRSATGPVPGPGQPVSRLRRGSARLMCGDVTANALPKRTEARKWVKKRMCLTHGAAPSGPHLN